MKNIRFIYPNTTLSRSFSILVLLGIFIGPPLTNFGQAIPKKTLLALSKNDHTLSIIDPISLKVLRTIPVGEDPHEVVASNDGTMAFVTIYGGGSLHELDMLDLVSMKPISNLDTKPFMGPHGISVSQGKVYFSAEGSKSVARLDPSTKTIDWCMGTGQDRTHMVLVSEDGKKVFTTNVSSATVSILTDSLVVPGPFPPGMKFPAPKPHLEWIQNLVPVAKGSEGFDISPNGQFLWTAGADEGIISIIDVKAKKKILSLDAKVIGANRLKFTPDGKRVLISSLRTGDVFVFDASTYKLIQKINIGQGAAGILIEEDGSRAFFGCTGDNYVAVLDLKNYQIIGHIPINGADGLAWANRP